MSSDLDAVRNFEHWMVLPGVISALALGRLLGGVAGLFQGRVRRAYHLHYVWAVILFVLQVQYWHVSAGWFGFGIGASLTNYFTYLIFPVSIFLAAGVLMPADMDRADFDCREHYFRQSAVFFSVCSVGILSVICTAKLFLFLPLLDRANTYRFFGGCVVLAMAFVGRGWGFAGRERLHQALTLVAVFLFVGFVYRFRP